MFKNKRGSKRVRKVSEEDASYKLNTNAVDRLVDANKGKVVKVDESEVDQYKSGKLQKIPAFIKAIFLKWWFAGACCFFFLMGLGAVIPNQMTLIFVLAFGSGIVTDLLVNNCLRFLESSEREYDKWIMFPWRKWFTIFFNVIYALIITGLVVKTYDGINMLIISAQQLDPKSVPLGVEPLLFGVFYAAYDVALVWFRNLIIFLANKIRNGNYDDEIM